MRTSSGLLVLRPGSVIINCTENHTSGSLLFKAAGDKLLMNKFIRQKFGGGLMLKNVISCTFGSRFRLNLTESLVNGGSATRLLLV